ncbi:unnamed protein product, partial [Ilex paraguariensis]
IGGYLKQHTNCVVMKDGAKRHWIDWRLIGIIQFHKWIDYFTPPVSDDMLVESTATHSPSSSLPTLAIKAAAKIRKRSSDRPPFTLVRPRVVCANLTV